MCPLVVWARQEEVLYMRNYSSIPHKHGVPFLSSEELVKAHKVSILKRLSGKNVAYFVHSEDTSYAGCLSYIPVPPVACVVPPVPCVVPPVPCVVPPVPCVVKGTVT